MSTLINVLQVPLPTKQIVPSDLRFLNRDIPTIEQLAAVKVDPKYSQWIRVLDTYSDAPDSENILYLLHYITVNNPNPEIMKNIGHVRGIIIDQNYKIVCRSFGYTPEITVDQFEDKHQTQEYNLFPALEGTVLRLFYYNVDNQETGGHWMISTHRKIDGTDSRWNGPTFGEMFNQLFNIKEDMLNKKCAYIYIIQHPENQQFFHVSKPFLAHVAIADENGLNYCGAPLRDVNIQEYVDSAFDSRTPTNVGLIALQHGSCSPVKIVSQHYIDLKNLRGNNPQLSTRYIHLLGDSRKDEFVENFPSQEYDKIDKKLQQLTNNIHRGYIVKFVKKGTKIFPKENHVVMMRCHSWYKEDPKNRVVREDVVKNMLETTPGHYLNTMLNNM